MGFTYLVTATSHPHLVQNLPSGLILPGGAGGILILGAAFGTTLGAALTGYGSNFFGIDFLPQHAIMISLVSYSGIIQGRDKILLNGDKGGSMFRKRKKKRLIRPSPFVPSEKDAPSGEYSWLNQQKTGDPTDHSGVPGQLKGMSELDAIAWIKANCKFAKNN
jgi:hypothetical protein